MFFHPRFKEEKKKAKKKKGGKKKWAKQLRSERILATALGTKLKVLRWYLLRIYIRYIYIYTYNCSLPVLRLWFWYNSRVTFARLRRGWNWRVPCWLWLPSPISKFGGPLRLDAIASWIVLILSAKSFETLVLGIGFYSGPALFPYEPTLMMLMLMEPY